MNQSISTYQKMLLDPVRLEEFKTRRRGYLLLSKFGITTEQYDQLLDQQDNKCGICGKLMEDPLHEKRFAVDHNHTTGEVRGLLCFHCNTALGKFNDDVDLLVKAIAYLTKNQ